ncbi:hypothetical protein VYU27_010091, partial [Nannochloropsis oceanica]
DSFEEAFNQQYATIHRLETNKLRNVAKLFSHLLYSDALPWTVFECIHLNEEETTSSSRIFIKILCQELSEHMGLAKLKERFTDPYMDQAFAGLFPKYDPRATRFAINFFVSIGLDTILKALHAQPPSPLLMHNALLALRKLAKKYEYKPQDRRRPFNKIITATFPSLYSLFKSILDNDSLESAEIQKLLLKILWSATQLSIPSSLSNHTLLQWMELVGHVLAKDLPDDKQPLDEDERKRWPWWKAKKWAACIAVRFFDRYGVPRLAGDSAQAKAFAKTFYDTVAPVLLQPMLNLMCLRSQGRFVTDRVLHLTLRYAKTSIEMAPTYQVLKPHLDILLFQVAFPLLQQKEDSLVQFQEDPQEYIRKMLGAGDLEDICYDPKDEALSLLTAAVEKRGKTALPRILAYIVQVLDAYNQQADPALKDYKAKDAALLLLGSLHRLLKSRNRPYRPQLCALLCTHVFPEF